MSRSTTLLLIAHGLVGAGLAGFAGCADTRAATPPPAAAAPAATAAPRPGLVATAGVLDGQGFVEFAAGREQGWQVGDVGRVMDGARVVGLIQIRDLIGKDRAGARLVGLSDAKRHPKPGDQVVPVQDVGAFLVDGSKAESAAQAAPAPADPASAGLRQHYQAELDRLAKRHQEDLNLLSQAHEQAIAELKRSAEGRDQLLAATHRAELASRDEQVVAAKREAAEAARLRIAQELADLTAERDRLQAQVDALMAASGAFNLHIKEMTLEAERRTRERATALAAEAEARDALARKLAELEQRVQGRISVVAAALTADPGRGEGVLDRIARLDDEVHLTTDRAIRAEHQLAEAQAVLLLERSKRERAEAETARLAALAGRAETTDARLITADAELAELRQRLADAKEQLAAGELNRLETERSLFDLAARVLRLQPDAAEVDRLKDRLRLLVAPRIEGSAK